MENRYQSITTLSVIVGTILSAISLTQPAQGYPVYSYTSSASQKQSSSPTQPKPCQAEWYQCIKQDHHNPKPDYVKTVINQYLAGLPDQKIIISLEDLFHTPRKKRTGEQICDEGSRRLYALMVGEKQSKDRNVADHFVIAARSICRQDKLPNRQYPGMQYKN